MLSFNLINCVFVLLASQRLPDDSEHKDDPVDVEDVERAEEEPECRDYV